MNMLSLNNQSGVHRRSREQGVTLIELLIVVVIIGVLAAVAIPNYMRHVDRGYRGDLQTALNEHAMFMQRFYGANNRYDRTLAGQAVALPAGRTVIPTGAAGNQVRYTINVVATATTFTLTGTRGPAMSSDACGDFTLNQAGQRGLVSGSLSMAECWK